MIQSPRGYPLLRDDPKGSLPDDPLTSSLWYDEVGNDLAWGMDARGQFKASWSCRANGSAIEAGDNQFGANNEGFDNVWRAETLGPFPLHRLTDGRPQPLRVVIDLKASEAEDVFAYVVLRHALDDYRPYLSSGNEDGWNFGYVTTDGTSYAALPLKCFASATESANPMRGFLQFPPDQWAIDTPVQGGPTLSKCVMACVDIYLGRMADTTVVSLGGYSCFPVSYGARSR